MTRKETYQNMKTKEVKQFEVEVDSNGLAPMYQCIDGDEWKAVTEWSLVLVNSQYFFESAHKNTVKFTKPPLEADNMPYKIR